MGARESQAMVRARKLVLGGMNAAQAASKTGITRQAIYMSRWYREYQTPAKLQSTSVR